MTKRTTLWSIVAVLGVGGLLSGALPLASSGDERLARPPEKGGKTLLECLWARQSNRRFSEAALPDGVLSRLLWCADGLNRPDSEKRTAPSAFSAYPVSLYVVEAARISLYDPETSALAPMRQSEAKDQDLRTLLLGKSSFARAPAILVLVADLDVFDDRVDAKMRLPWIHAECGAIGQNVYLACADLGFGTVFAAVMDPAATAKVLELEEGLVPCYLMPVGKPLPR